MRKSRVERFRTVLQKFSLRPVAPEVVRDVDHASMSVRLLELRSCPGARRNEVLIQSLHHEMRIGPAPSDVEWERIVSIRCDAGLAVLHGRSRGLQYCGVVCHLDRYRPVYTRLEAVFGEMIGYRAWQTIVSDVHGRSVSAYPRSKTRIVRGGGTRYRPSDWKSRTGFYRFFPSA